MTARVTLTDDDGNPLLTYVEDTLDHRPTADDVELAAGVDAGTAARAVLARMPGWVVGRGGPLLDALLAAGARERRRAFTYTWDLTVRTPPAGWGDLAPTGELRVEPVGTRTAADLLETARAAYPPDHPDAGRDGLTDLREILAGELVGPFLTCSEVVLDGDRVVAVLLMNDAPTPPPDGGPWVTDVFRHPDAAYAGLGALLLRRGLAHLAADGRASLGLAVTAGNPARRTYEQVGFRLVAESRSVFVPGEAPLAPPAPK
jgi:GNAT superfamily N-acetyltransferase